MENMIFMANLKLRPEKMESGGGEWGVVLAISSNIEIDYQVYCDNSPVCQSNHLLFLILSIFSSEATL